MNTNEFDSRLKEAAGEAEEILRRFLPEETGLQRELFEAMNYSLTAGGKRLRPILMRETYRMCGGTDEYVIGCFMAAIEMIHTMICRPWTMTNTAEAERPPGMYMGMPWGFWLETAC